MRMKPKTLAGLIILLLFLALIPPVSGDGWPEEQTRHIIEHPPETGTDGDWFVTESGLGFYSSLVTVLDPNMDIRGYLFFKDIKINTYFHLENATLRLHTASTLDFDNESTFTIYGIPDYRYFGMGEWGYGSPSEIMNAPLTSAHVNYNSSQFYGSQWWDIDVTDIVQELYSNPWYEGPGVDYGEPGDYMAFIMLGSGGHDSRWFYDLSAGNGYEAQLHLHWDFSPPLPTGGGTFNSTYRTYDIFIVSGKEKLTTEFYEWTNPQGAISLSNDYLLDLDDFSWDSFYPGGGAFQDHFIKRKESLPDYTEKIEVRSYNKIVLEEFITSRPDWYLTSIDNKTGFTQAIAHFIDPGSSTGAHDNHFFQTTQLYFNTITHAGTGDEWWSSWIINQTHISLSVYEGITEPNWGVDVADQYDDNVVLSWGNFTENFKLADATTADPSKTGAGHYQLGYVAILLDEVELLEQTWTITDENGTTIVMGLDSYEDAIDYIDDILGDDPEEPDPGGEWSSGPGGETGAFTRFRIRLWFLIIGFGCFFGPILFFAWRRPSGYYLMAGSIVMLIGVGLLLSIAQV